MKQEDLSTSLWISMTLTLFCILADHNLYLTNLLKPLLRSNAITVPYEQLVLLLLDPLCNLLSIPINI